MSERLETAIAIFIAACAMFVFCWGIYWVDGKDKYKDRYVEMLKENNRLLKENIALSEKIIEVKREHLQRNQLLHGEKLR